MAKANYSCASCANDVTIVGRNRSEADRLAKWHEAHGHICRDCEQKQLAEKNAMAAAANAAAGLPPLSGSEKAVAWAESIRATVLGNIQTAAQYVCMPLNEAAAAIKVAAPEPRKAQNIAQLVWSLRNAIDPEDPAAESVLQAFKAALRAQVTASWWIDNRDRSFEALADGLRAQIMAAMVPAAAPSEHEAAAVAEALLKPAGEPVSSAICDLRTEGRQITAAFPEKRDDFREVIKSMGFAWSGTNWARSLDVRAGDPEDRLAEVAHRLVGAGFVVSLHHEKARSMAITGEFKPESTRWVTRLSAGPRNGWLSITWRKPDDLYNAARSLPGSRYEKGAVLVPPGAVEAVAEFAERFGFSLSAGAQEVLDQHRAALAGGAVVSNIKDQPAPLRGDFSAKPQRLDVPTDGDVDAALLDDH